jgi:DNA repair protein RecO (recombination protein O)
MNIFETEAIVLRTQDYGESDRVVTFYTRAGGRIRGIAKGARRSKKRFANVFELCSLVELKYRTRKTSVWIEECKLLEPHLELRTGVERWGYAALVSEITLEMVPEAEAQEELFLLLKETFGRLAGGKDPLNVVLLFIFRFLDLMGYLPALERCSVCKRPVTSATHWWWQMSQGELTCSEHRSVRQDHVLLDLGTLVLIAQSRRLPLDRIWRLHLSRQRKIPLLHGFVGWIREQIRKDLKSLKLLEQVQPA